jgi:hypothetical protein
MAAPQLHSDQVGLNILIGENLRLAGRLGLLTDANVTGAATYADLKNSIDTNARTLHSDMQGYADRLKRSLDLGFADGSFTDTNVANATSLENLATMTLAQGTGPILE